MESDMKKKSSNFTRVEFKVLVSEVDNGKENLKRSKTNDDNHSTRSPKRVKTTATDDSLKSKMTTPTLTNDRDFKIPLMPEC